MDKQKLIAVIDIGSHTVKLYVGEILRKKQIKLLDYLWVPVAIGKDTLARGLITNATIHEVSQSIKNYTEVIESYQIKDWRIVASSSILDATNADVLMERVYQTTDIRAEILEPVAETEMIYEGIKTLLKKRYGFLENNYILFSIGGSSSQVILQSKGKIVLSETHHIGIQRIIKEFDFSEKAYKLTLKPFTIGFLNHLKRFPEVKKLEGFIAVNDDILALVHSFFAGYLDQGVYQIPRKEFNLLYSRIDSISLDEYIEQYYLSENMKKSIRVAILMIGLFFNLTEAEYILIPASNKSYFMMYQMAFHERDQLKLGADMRENILSSAYSLGKKYQFDREHAHQVARLSTAIFDQMAVEYGFRENERLYLEVAAILHDIGSFVSPSSHNKHSAQLIMSSEILGLHRNEMKLIALIARYHRKSMPKQSHEEYNELPMDDRMTVSRLSSILRIADGLDNTHAQIVETLRLSLTDELCEMQLKIKDGNYAVLDIIRAAVKKKSDLFESFFGVPVKLERSV